MFFQRLIYYASYCGKSFAPVFPLLFFIVFFAFGVFAVEFRGILFDERV